MTNRTLKISITLLISFILQLTIAKQSSQNYIYDQISLNHPFHHNLKLLKHHSSKAFDTIKDIFYWAKEHTYYNIKGAQDFQGNDILDLWEESSEPIDLSQINSNISLNLEENIIYQNVSKEWNFDQTGPRQLQGGKCNRGKAVQVFYEAWYCSPYTQFQTRKLHSDCTLAKNISVEKCYCPFDYYGEFCEIRNDIECASTMINPSFDCYADDSYDYLYSSSIPNFRPCNRVKRGQLLNFRVSLNCSYTHGQLFEGIKEEGDKYEDFRHYHGKPLTFNYLYSNDEYKFSEPRKQRYYLQFYKAGPSYTHLDRLYTGEIDDLFLNGQAGVTLTLDDQIMEYSAYGRIYFMFYHQNDVVGTGFFEIDEYKEPQQTLLSTVSMPVIIAMTLLMVAIGSCSLCYCISKRKKEFEEINSQVEIEMRQLIPNESQVDQQNNTSSLRDTIDE